MVISIYIISREFVNPQIVICVLVVTSQFPFLMSNTKKRKDFEYMSGFRIEFIICILEV